MLGTRALRRWRTARSPFYRRFPVENGEMLLSIDQRIAVSREKGFIYFRIPKAANSTVVSALHEGATAEGYVSRDAKHSFARASTLSRDEVANLRDRFFLFSVVRDPFSRLLSAYLDKIRRGKSGRRPVAAYYRRAPGADISFLEFCRFIADGGVAANPHWYRQVDLIPCGLDFLHYLGRVESLSTDLDVIRRRIRIDVGHRIDSWNPHRTDAAAKLQQMYCPESIALVQSVYRQDFEALGYAMEPDWARAVMRSS